MPTQEIGGLLKGEDKLVDEGMTPRSSIFAYPVPAKKEARSKDTRSPQGPALRLGVEGKKPLVNPNWLHI
jgi:hypothetical protein